MYEKILEGYDLVCGSRYMKGSNRIGGNLIKKFLSKSASLALHFLINIPTHDLSNGFNMYRRSIFDEISIESKAGFEILPEITIKSYLNGKRITEVPVEFRERKAGESKFKMWRWMPYYLRWYIYGIIKTLVQ
jgi:hypothetical protein